jgi:hypothetical protein
VCSGCSAEQTVQRGANLVLVRFSYVANGAFLENGGSCRNVTFLRKGGKR